MSFKYEIYDNNGWLSNFKTNEYQETKLPKLFNGDILNDEFVITESSVSESKSLIGIFSTSQTQRFGKNKRGNVIFLVSPLNLVSLRICIRSRAVRYVAFRIKGRKE